MIEGTHYGIYLYSGRSELLPLKRDEVGRTVLQKDEAARTSLRESQRSSIADPDLLPGKIRLGARGILRQLLGVNALGYPHIPQDLLKEILDITQNQASVPIPPEVTDRASFVLSPEGHRQSAVINPNNDFLDFTVTTALKVSHLLRLTTYGYNRVTRYENGLEERNRQEVLNNIAVMLAQTDLTIKLLWADEDRVKDVFKSLTFLPQDWEIWKSYYCDHLKSFGDQEIPVQDRG